MSSLLNYTGNWPSVQNALSPTLSVHHPKTLSRLETLPPEIIFNILGGLGEDYKDLQKIGQTYCVSKTWMKVAASYVISMIFKKGFSPILFGYSDYYSVHQLIDGQKGAVQKLNLELRERVYADWALISLLAHCQSLKAVKFRALAPSFPILSLGTNFTHLNELHLASYSSDQPSDFPIGLDKLPNLTKLILTDFTDLSNFTELPKLIGLKILAFKATDPAKGLREVSPHYDMEILPDLKELTIENCTPHFTFPSWLWKLKDLRTLHLNHCSVALNEEIVNLERLEHLSLKGYPFLLPPAVFKISTLKELVLSGGRFELPPAISDLTHLERLEITDYKHHKFPQTFKNLQNLKTLVISASCINSLATLIGLPALEVLKISKLPSLRGLPADLRKLTTLRELSIETLIIDKFPKGMRSLKNLRTLTLHKITVLHSSAFPTIFSNKNLRTVVVTDSTPFENVLKMRNFPPHLRFVSFNGTVFVPKADSAKATSPDKEIVSSSEKRTSPRILEAHNVKRQGLAPQEEIPMDEG